MGVAMTATALLFFLPGAILLGAGIALVWRAISASRSGAIGRTSAALRIIAGGGALGCAAVAVSPLWSDMTYGVLLLPIAALLGATVWMAILIGAAAVAERRRRERPRP